MSQGLFASITGAVIASVSTVTTTATAVNRLATAADELAKVAENKAKRFGELIEIRDQMVYNTAKSELDAQLAALGVAATTAAKPAAPAKPAAAKPVKSAAK